MNEKRIGSCLAGCEAPCMQTLEVNVAVSTSKYPAVGFTKGMAARMKQLNVDGMTAQRLEGLIVLEIFFDSTSQMVMEQNEKVPFFKLIGNIGGVLGKNGPFFWVTIG